MPSLTEEAAAPPAHSSPARRPVSTGAGAHAAAPAPGAIHQGDCVELLRRVPDESVDLAFADPPYNIGFKYDEYHDRHEDEVYLAWCERWIAELYRVVKPTGAFWLAIGDEYAAELKVAARRIGFTTRNWVVWYYTFGQNCTRKFNRSHAHLLHFIKDEERHTFNAADPAIRVPSARALVYGDRRANPTGRLPDDTWLVRPEPGDGRPEEDSLASRSLQPDFVLRPQDLRDDPDAFHPQDDTWYFSRVAGTFKERQGFHGCQMPEQMIGRIVRVSSNEGQLVLDPFAGSGTTLAVAKKLGRRWMGFELSRDYVRYGTDRVRSVAEGDPLCGPADPVRSAPTTAKGRRLKGHPMAEEASANGHAAPPPAPAPARPGGAGQELRELTRQALVDAFHAAAGGASLDWLLCRADLQAALHERCEEAGLLGGPADWNRELLKLRKAGLLKASAPNDQPSKADRPGGVSAAAMVAGETAWARARTKHAGRSLDQLLSDPATAATFDRAAAKGAPGEDPALCRWAALRLRKAAKSHKEEASRWGYVVDKLVDQLADSRARKLTPRAIQPLRDAGGVYAIVTGPKPADGAAVYVGEADNLHEQLAQRIAHPLARGASYFVALEDARLPSDAYRHALRWNLVHRLRPALSIDLLADAEVF